MNPKQYSNEACCNQPEGCKSECVQKDIYESRRGAVGVCDVPTPRPGAQDYARIAVSRIVVQETDALEREIIRAREIGQREGREDEKQEREALMRIQRIITITEECYEQLWMQAVKPIYVSQRVPHLEREIEEASAENIKLKKELEKLNWSNRHRGCVVVSTIEGFGKTQRTRYPEVVSKEVHGDGSVSLVIKKL